MSGFSEIHWSEGMLLQTQHLQLLQRGLARAVEMGVSGLHPYSWGVRRLEINRAALANFTVSVTRCDVRLPDGTELRVPEEATLPDLDVKAAIEKGPGGPLEIRLGVPSHREGEPNVAESVDADKGLPRRYRLGTTEAPDENTGGSPRTIQVRRLSPRLFAPGDEAIKYSSSLPVLRIVRAGEGDFQPKLDEDFVAPSLELKASATVQRLADEVFQAATAKAEALSKEIVDRRLDFAGGGPVLLKLQVLNGFLPWYRQLLQVPQLHPFTVYLELCRLAGQVAVFTEERAAPRIPFYDHRDPGPGFRELFRIVQDLLRRMDVPKGRSIAFAAKGRYLEAKLDGSWLTAGSRLYLAVDSDLPRDEVVHVVVRQISVGPSKSIEALAKSVLPGIARQPVDSPPPGLPKAEGRHYFALEALGESEDLAIYNPSGKELKLGLYVTGGAETTGL